MIHLKNLCKASHNFLKAIKEYGVEIIYDYHSINGMALKKPVNKMLEETMQYFKTVKGVLNVEYDHIIRLTDPVKPKLFDELVSFVRYIGNERKTTTLNIKEYRPLLPDRWKDL